MPVPDDLLAFLRSGSQLRYDVEKSLIGAITFRSADDLPPVTLLAGPGCQDLEDIDDPYDDLEGDYLVEVVDLIATSADYDPQGLLCWILALHAFGFVDQEHGTIRTFPGVTWRDIEAKPLKYLDAQWMNGGTLVLPWLHFPFRVRELADGAPVERIIPPIPKICPVHGGEVAKLRVRRATHYAAIRERNIDDWLNRLFTEFPCPGVRSARSQSIGCPDCRAAENAWYRETVDAMPVLTARANSAGYVPCPGCGTRFSIHDKDRYSGGVHTSCGQKVRVEEAPPD